MIKQDRLLLTSADNLNVGTTSCHVCCNGDLTTDYQPQQFPDAPLLCIQTL
jgi:hypothetical protein